MSVPTPAPARRRQPRSARAVYDVALLDLDGVVYVGPDAVPGVPEALRDARAAGMRLGFVTNNAARTPEEVAGHLTELGVPAEPGDVITSSQAAATRRRRDCWAGRAASWPVGGPGVAAALDRGRPDRRRTRRGPARRPSSRATAATSAGRSSPRPSSPSATAPGTSPPTPTRPSPRPAGPLPGNGAMVGVVRDVTGQEPLVTGKPDPAMHAECVRRTGARRPLVVGDRLDTDIEGARRAGAASLLVLLRGHRPGRSARRRSRAPARPPGGRRRRPAAAAPGRSPPTGRPGGAGTGRCAPPRARACSCSTAHSRRTATRRTTHGDGDGLDGLRALCVAHWSRHPEHGAPARVVAAGPRARRCARAAGACRRPERDQRCRRSEQLAQPQQVAQPRLELDPSGRPGRAEGSRPSVSATRSSLVIVSRMSAFGTVGPVAAARAGRAPRPELSRPTHDLVQVGQPAGAGCGPAPRPQGWPRGRRGCPWRAFMH